MTEAKKSGERINGVVEDIVFRNDGNGYSIIEIFSEELKELVTVVGTMPFVGVGETVTLTGEWVFHNEYGKQFRADCFEKRIPEDESSILKYLSSGIIKGIGPKTAEKIVEKYGSDTFEVMSNHPDWLSEFKGITAERALEISVELRRQMGFYKLFDFCRSYVSMNVALKIYNLCGDDAIARLKANPYAFCGKVRGYDFSSADAIAVGLGCPPDSAERILGATVRVLELAAESGGHSCLPVKTAIQSVSEMLKMDSKQIAETVKMLVLSGEIGYYHRAEGSLLYINSYFEAEKSIAGKLRHIDRSCIGYSVSDMEPLIRRAELDCGIEFAPMQKKAIFEAASSGVLVITGGPGTGKTTIIRALIRIYESMGCNIELAAPTGRAAKRMSEATSYPARTIHRLLEVEYRDDDTAVFARDEHNMLDADIIIIDEASMIDMFLMRSLLSAVRPGARLVLIGDCDQLPSVSAGNVLHDIIECSCFNTVKLTEIFRQGKSSLIVTNAHRINHGEMPITDTRDNDFFFMKRTDARMIADTLVDVCVNRLPKTYNVSPFEKIQVITPTKKGAVGTEALNRALQNALNPKSDAKNEKVFREQIFREGDKVMQIRNNYDLVWHEGDTEKNGIFNGDIGIIEKIYDRQSYMMIDFDGREVKYEFSLLEDLEHAYAVTVHKSQGSEYPFVVMPVCEVAPALMTRNLLYTAVTRAKQMAVLIGNLDSVQRMVENNREAVRYTGLCSMLEASNGRDN